MIQISPTEYIDIKTKVDKIIALIKWKSNTVSFESKQNKVIKELSQIKSYCQSAVNNELSSKSAN